MARYYEENALIEFVKQYTPTIEGTTTLECVERAIRNAPTADVVPVKDLEKLMALNNKFEAKIYEERKAKSEVAREIITDLAYNKNLLMLPSWAIEELIKEYTEGE